MNTTCMGVPLLSVLRTRNRNARFWNANRRIQNATPKREFWPRRGPMPAQNAAQHAKSKRGAGLLLQPEPKTQKKAPGAARPKRNPDSVARHDDCFKCHSSRPQLSPSRQLLKTQPKRSQNATKRNVGPSLSRAISARRGSKGYTQGA